MGSTCASSFQLWYLFSNSGNLFARVVVVWHLVDVFVPGKHTILAGALSSLVVVREDNGMKSCSPDKYAAGAHVTAK